MNAVLWPWLKVCEEALGVPDEVSLGRSGDGCPLLQVWWRRLPSRASALGVVVAFGAVGGVAAVGSRGPAELRSPGALAEVLARHAAHGKGTWRWRWACACGPAIHSLETSVCPVCGLTQPAAPWAGANGESYASRVEAEVLGGEFDIGRGR